MSLSILYFLSLITLFAFLGWSADLTVKNIKFIASTLKMKVFALGILLGILTTLPELFVGINATLEGIASLSVGNLLGGIMVSFGLIIGASAVLNHGIKTNNNAKLLLPTLLFIFLAISLGVDGKYNTWDGLMMIFFYFGLLFYLWRISKPNNIQQEIIINRNKIIRAAFFSLVGVVLVILTSHWIIKIVVEILENTNINKMAIGLLIFSLGTNLPEIIIAVTSWRRKAAELSLGHIISSVLVNLLILGLLAAIKPIEFNINLTYIFLILFLLFISVLFFYFCQTRKRIDKKEGKILLTVYLLFFILNILLIIL